jgi:hypothetical protein
VRFSTFFSAGNSFTPACPFVFNRRQNFGRCPNPASTHEISESYYIFIEPFYNLLLDKLAHMGLRSLTQKPRQGASSLDFLYNFFLFSEG